MECLIGRRLRPAVACGYGVQEPVLRDDVAGHRDDDVNLVDDDIVAHYYVQHIDVDHYCVQHIDVHHNHVVVPHNHVVIHHKHRDNNHKYDHQLPHYYDINYNEFCYHFDVDDDDYHVDDSDDIGDHDVLDVDSDYFGYGGPDIGADERADHSRAFHDAGHNCTNIGVDIHPGHDCINIGVDIQPGRDCINIGATDDIHQGQGRDDRRSVDGRANERCEDDV